MRWCADPPTCRSCSSSPIGRPRHRRRPGRRAARRVRRDRARRALGGRRGTDRPHQGRSSWSDAEAEPPAALRGAASPNGPRATRSTSRSWSSYLAAHGASTSATRGRSPRSICPRASTASSSAGSTRCAEEPRRTLKVASVIGRVFRAPVLPERLSGARVAATTSAAHLGSLRGADLVTPRPRGRRGVPVQARRHPGGGVREPAVRRPGDPARLVGDYLERSAGETLDQQLDLLAHHYWHSDDEAKKVTYLGRAGGCRAGGLREHRGRRLPDAPVAPGGRRGARRGVAEARPDPDARRRPRTRG